MGLAYHAKYSWLIRTTARVSLHCTRSQSISGCSTFTRPMLNRKIRFSSTFSGDVEADVIDSNKLRWRTLQKMRPKDRVWMVLLACVPVITFGLGTWQVQRLRWKVALIDELEERLNMPPALLPRRIKPKVLEQLNYRLVYATGRLHHNQEMLVGIRTYESKHGYYVVTPFERENGDTVLVNRGWIPRERADPTTRANGQIEGTVTVTGLVKQGEKKGLFVPDNQPERNEWLWFDVPTMAEQVGSEPLLIEESLAVSPSLVYKLIDDGIPVGKVPGVNLRNTHLQYAITWYSLTIATSMMLFFMMRKPKKGKINYQMMRG